MKEYPHICPKCGSAAFVGFHGVDCPTCNGGSYKVFKLNDCYGISFWICKSREDLGSLVDSIFGQDFFNNEMGGEDEVSISEMSLSESLKVMDESGEWKVKTVKEWIETYNEEGLLASSIVD